MLSCTRTNEKLKNNETSEAKHILDFIPANKNAIFKAIRNDNAIALRLKKIDTLRLEYRIELNRQWKGSRFDSGTVDFTALRGDSLFVFDGATIDCKLRVMLYRASPQDNFYAQVERVCSDSMDNITTTDFPVLWSEHSFR